MRGVAEQDDPATAPAAQWPRHEQPPAQVMANRVDHFDHGRMPAFEEGERVLGGCLDEPLFRMRPHVRRVDDSEEIHVVAFWADGVVEGDARAAPSRTGSPPRRGGAAIVTSARSPENRWFANNAAHRR